MVVGSRWHDAIWPTREQLDTYERAESLLHESQSRRCQHQRGDHGAAMNSTEAHAPLSRCWAHEASYTRWCDFYIRNGETAEAAGGMARYQAGESQCNLCIQLATGAHSPGDTAGQSGLAPESASYPDTPFHTTDADGHSDDSDPNDTGTAAAPGTTTGGEDTTTTTNGGHAAPPWPPTAPLGAPGAEPHQHAQDTTDAGSTAVNPPPRGQPNPTRTGAARRPPTTPPSPPLPPMFSPARTPALACPPTPNRAPTPTPQRRNSPHSDPAPTPTLCSRAAVPWSSNTSALTRPPSRAGAATTLHTALETRSGGSTHRPCSCQALARGSRSSRITGPTSSLSASPRPKPRGAASLLWAETLSSIWRTETSYSSQQGPSCTHQRPASG